MYKLFFIVQPHSISVQLFAYGNFFAEHLFYEMTPFRELTLQIRTIFISNLGKMKQLMDFFVE